MKVIDCFEWLKNIIGDCGFVSSEFPESECTNPSEKEEGVFDGEREYLCIIADQRFPRTFRMEVMKPYVYKNADGTFFGWTGVDFDSIISFWKNPVHSLDDEFVVAWKPI